MSASESLGWCDPETQVIAVSGDLSADSMQDVFLHEVLHSIAYVMGLKEKETEENYVRSLATGLCTVWNANPSVWSWWSALSRLS